MDFLQFFSIKKTLVHLRLILIKDINSDCIIWICEHVWQCLICKWATWIQCLSYQNLIDDMVVRLRIFLVNVLKTVSMIPLVHQLRHENMCSSRCGCVWVVSYLYGDVKRSRVEGRRHLKYPNLYWKCDKWIKMLRPDRTHDANFIQITKEKLYINFFDSLYNLKALSLLSLFCGRIINECLRMNGTSIWKSICMQSIFDFLRGKTSYFLNILGEIKIVLRFRSPKKMKVGILFNLNNIQWISRNAWPFATVNFFEIENVFITLDQKMKCLVKKSLNASKRK